MNAGVRKNRDAPRAAPRQAAGMHPNAPTPASRHAALVTAACRRIESAQAPPSLADLAREAGLSAPHFQRVFKAMVGVTPKAYAQAHRGQLVRAALAGKGARVTDVLFEAGFNASSRFYERADAMLGMTPTQYRDGGADARIEFALGQCSLGAVLVARSARGVCAISLGDDPEALLRALQDRFPRADLVGGDAEFEHLVARVVGFIEAPRLGLALPLDVRGTAFQQRVWDALRRIPSGETASYAQVAVAIGAPASARAVASACASNPLAVAIPCHRVVRSDGGLSGYRWGVARKRELLARERGG